jgi:glycosyltransferase involved in cell wall biosynthesis
MEKQITVIDHVGNKAGIDFYSLSLLEALAKNQTRVSYYSNFKHSSTSVHARQTFYFQSSSSRLLKALGFFQGYISAIFYCILRKERNILFHSFSYTYKDLGMVLFMLVGNRTLFTIAHDVENFSAGDKFWIKKFILQRCRRIMVHNEFSKKELELLHIPQTAQKTVVIPHGHFLELNKQQLNQSSAKHSLHLDANQIHLLFFGQIKAVKGLSILIEAMALLPENFHLVIAGKPQYSTSEIETRIQDLHLEQRVTKAFRYITNEERNLYFSAADTAILPYTKIYQSGVLLMSMSYGIPCVTSDLAAFKEIISNGENGMLFQSENANDLAEKIRELFSSKVACDSVRSKALQTMHTNHDWNAIALQFKSSLL